MTGTAIVALVLFGLVALVYVLARLNSNGSKTDHGHDHGDGGWDDDFDDVHSGKDIAGGCKFDPDEVRRTAFMLRPEIDLSNLPAPDARVKALIDAVSEDEVRQILMQLSGEVPVVIDGKTVTIVSRNSHTQGVLDAMTLVERFYKALGIPTRRIPYKARGRTYFNLEATIVGHTTPMSVLILGSHLDSTAGWVSSAEKQAPGADDDGSGTVALMQIAKALSQLPLDCTVRLVHFTGEEQGLWGSYRYSDELSKESGIKVVGMIQHDMVGYSPNDKARLDVHDEEDRNGSHAWTVLYFRNIKRYGIGINPYDTHNRAVKNRSDHAGFLDHGYTAVMLSEEFTDEGFNPNYHSLGDRVKSVNFTFLTNVIRSTITVAADLAGLR
ncbi:MAG: M28 family peptidase [Candidatus Obscuribacterales bacterium]|nr:M28 family peptidase [Candidatus Obscuribacterales bacterium]